MCLERYEFPNICFLKLRTDILFFEQRMGHFKEIEIGFINISFPRIGSNNSPLAPFPYPHPRCGKTNPGNGNDFFLNTLLIAFYDLCKQM